MTTNVLVSSAGRRVGLLNCIRESLADLGIRGRITAIDVTPYSPAAQLADVFYQVPRCTDSEFLDEVEQICKRDEVTLIIPTIDTELPVYGQAKERLRRHGTHVAISSTETIEICRDKVLTSEWLEAYGFPVPRQSFPSQVLSDKHEWPLPLIVKPRAGSASVGFRCVNSFEELAATWPNGDDLIVQELLEGQEYTVNVFVNRAGKCVCAVPHVRLEVRGGEVSKGITSRDEDLIRLITDVVDVLPGAYGPLNIQCFLTPKGTFKIIEMNARFGGGYPLAHRAGAPITRWLIEETLGLEARGPFDAWEDGLTMLRYDEALFISSEKLVSAGCTTTVPKVCDGCA